MDFCPDCGTKLVPRTHRSGAELPYCEGCERFKYPTYNTAVIIITVDKASGKILLIQQYGKPSYILVAGYVNRGESAEDAVRRELMEETGLEAVDICFNRSHFYERSNALMLNFTAYIKDAAELHTNEEVDSYCWFTFDEARENIRPGSLASEFLNEWIDKHERLMP